MIENKENVFLIITKSVQKKSRKCKDTIKTARRAREREREGERKGGKYKKEENEDGLIGKGKD